MLEWDLLRIDDPAWFAFVEGAPEATAFHHPAWARLLADCYGFRPFALAARDPAARIVAGLPLLEVRRPLRRPRWVSLPFTDYCPPLGTIPAPAAQVRARGVAALDIHGQVPLGVDVYTRVAALRHTTPLAADPSEVWRRIAKMHQRGVAKAERSGVRVERGASAADLRRFYDLHLMTRRRLGVPIQPRRFFDLLAAELERGLGFVLTAYRDDTPVAAAVFLVWNGVLIYKFGASDPAAWEHRPNHLLFWTALRWGCEQGCHTFDWGRTDHEDVGLREFKQRWGAVEEPLVYSTIASRAPGAVAAGSPRMLGEIIRRSPPWVCRVLGERLYRYAA